MMDGFPIVPLLIMAMFSFVSLAWSVGVIVMLYKIWQKVKHLPG